MMIREMHLFAGIGGGIYGGQLLGHKCVAGVEIDKYCQGVLLQRQRDGWMDNFTIYGDITQLAGQDFRGKFDVLCGGFPCQAFSHAAHGNNIATKNLWGEMKRFIEESNAPIVFGENVTVKAIENARVELEEMGYDVKICSLSCAEIGADHRRVRFWLLAEKDGETFLKLVKNIINQPKLRADIWTYSPDNFDYPQEGIQRGHQLKAVGNAQSPFVAAAAFRILVNRHIKHYPAEKTVVTQSEIDEVFDIQKTWIKQTYGENIGFVHTPTTIANYNTPSMQKHLGCRNYHEIFDKPKPKDAEYLMGFPIGASYPGPMNSPISKPWNQVEGEDS